jgi:hypothetical protein
MPSDLPRNPAHISQSGYANVAPSDNRGVNRCGHGHLVCKFPINVTVPSALLTVTQRIDAQQIGTDCQEPAGLIK